MRAVIFCFDMVKPRAALIFSSFVFLSTLLLCPKLSVAGVIVETEDLSPAPQRTIKFIQGHRMKVGDASASSPTDPIKLLKSIDRWTIFDLDKGTSTEIDYAQKSYVVTPYPGEDNPAPTVVTENYSPTGKRRKVAGYWCKEYSAKAESAKFGEWTDFECVSSDPPGAKEYDEFEKLDNSKLVKAGYAPPGYQPDGFVLDSRTEGDESAPGERIILIESKPIAPAELEPPAGFVKDKDP
jgi:hypothetical protein